MTKDQEYKRDVVEWARHFKVPVPLVQVMDRPTGNYKFYRWKNGRRVRLFRVLMPASGIHAHQAALIHEFAHHLQAVRAVRGGGVRAWSEIRGHGGAFVTTLVEVATFVLGRPEDYPWHREYKRITRWAIEHGLAPKRKRPRP